MSGVSNEIKELVGSVSDDELQKAKEILAVYEALKEHGLVK